MVKLFVTFALTTVLVASVCRAQETRDNRPATESTSNSQAQDGLPTQSPTQTPSFGNSLFGGFSGGPQGQQNGQMPPFNQIGGWMNNMIPGQQEQEQRQQQQQMMMPPRAPAGGLAEMLRNIPQRGIQMIQNFVNGVRSMLPGGRQGFQQQQQQQQQQGSRNPMGMMQPMNGQQSNMQDPASNNQMGGNLNGLLNNPLGSLTSGLNLQNLPNSLGQPGNQLNGLTQGLQRSVSDVGQTLSQTLSNVMPNLSGGAATNQRSYQGVASNTAASPAISQASSTN